MAEQEPEERSRAAGGCVLLSLTAAAGAGIWEASPDAAVLTLWVIGTGAIWWSARRRVSDMPATPPTPATGTVYAAHGDEIERVQEGPGEGLTILYPVRYEVDQSSDGQ